ncbi:hypothetical protein H8L32_00055 [Undibacterium sp. CY18W]|uniref:Uncharacterized protein n=1 Tax=Undibacterium hunanense TaxID=2762292 RepID=A0ABR6ZIY5_9BURK|nr:hypothetical protein [Undibacterium hunanense]MBC3915861.1 hypothetical protein [Undibacterium hunanense]
MKSTIKYAIFAPIAAAVNIRTRDMATCNRKQFFVALILVAARTGASPITKYILDKRYIDLATGYLSKYTADKPSVFRMESA